LWKLRDTKFRQIQSLSLNEWRWLLAALVLLPAAGVSLRRAGLRWTIERFERFLAGHRERSSPAASAADAAAIGRAVRLAAVYGPYHARCLPRAVVLWTLLRRRSLDGEMTIGVRKTGGKLEAHAWVELDGVALAQSQETVPFVRLRTASSSST
jgi:hypothetical protein